MIDDVWIMTIETTLFKYWTTPGGPVIKMRSGKWFIRWSFGFLEIMKATLTVSEVLFLNLVNKVRVNLQSAGKSCVLTLILSANSLLRLHVVELWHTSEKLGQWIQQPSLLVYTIFVKGVVKNVKWPLFGLPWGADIDIELYNIQVWCLGGAAGCRGRGTSIRGGLNAQEDWDNWSTIFC